MESERTPAPPEGEHTDWLERMLTEPPCTYGHPLHREQWANVQAHARAELSALRTNYTQARLEAEESLKRRYEVEHERDALRTENAALRKVAEAASYSASTGDATRLHPALRALDAARPGWRETK